MAERHSTVWRPIKLALALTVWVPSVAWAQAAPVTRTTAPGITASFDVGFGVQYCCPDEPLSSAEEPRNYGNTDNYVSPQAGAGIEVAVTKLVTLFGAVRIDDGVTPYGGVRVAITTRPAGPLTAPDVRVTSTNGGDHHGRHVSLTASEVIIRQSGRSVVLPIGEVQRVEKTSHRIRNGMITGAILGYVTGYFLSCGTGDEEDCWPEVGLLVAGIGTGAGALLGSSLNHRAAHDGRDVLYAGSGRAPGRCQVAPLVSPRRAGLGLLLRW